MTFISTSVLRKLIAELSSYLTDVSWLLGHRFRISWFTLLRCFTMSDFQNALPAGLVPRSCFVHLKMAQESYPQGRLATRIFEKHPSCVEKKTKKLGPVPFTVGKAPLPRKRQFYQSGLLMTNFWLRKGSF